MLENAIKFFSLFMVFVIQISTFNCFADKLSSYNGPIDFFSSIPNANVKFQPSLSTTTSTSDKSPSNTELNASFNNFPNVNVMFQSATTETSGTLGQPTFSFSHGNNFSNPIDTASASAVSSFQTSMSSTTPSSLETFISTFTNAVHTSPVLANLLDLSQIPLQDIETFLYYIRVVMESMGVPDLSEVLTFSSLPLTERVEIMTYPMKVRIDATAMGKFLLAEGILNDTNAASLALAFANEMKSSAKRTVQKYYPRSKFQALVDGYVSFFKSQDLFTPEKITAAGRYFGDEIRLAIKRFGISAPNYASANL